MGSWKTEFLLFWKMELQFLPSVLKPIVGRKICILGDCSGVVDGEGSKAVLWSRPVDPRSDPGWHPDGQAEEHGHSTPQMAAAFLKLCRAKRLVLTHFSQGTNRCLGQKEKADGIVELKKQAESVLDLQEVTLAEDFMVISIPIKKWNQYS